MLLLLMGSIGGGVLTVALSHFPEIEPELDSLGPGIMQI
jgi:hypothetical protein